MTQRNDTFKRYLHDAGGRAEVAMHAHSNGQLSYVSYGTMRLLTAHSGANTSRIIPHRRLVWIPPECPHAVHCNDLSGSWKIMLPRAWAKLLPDQVSVLKTGDLLKAALEALPEYGSTMARARQRLLIDVIEMELAQTDVEQFGITFPTSPRLVQVCEHLLAHPDDNKTLEQWADKIGMSRRSFIRAFAEETGSPFAAWKRALQLELSLEWLAAGASVNATADKLGYAEPSAFVAAFRKRFGVTPGRFFR